MALPRPSDHILERQKTTARLLCRAFFSL